MLFSIFQDFLHSGDNLIKFKEKYIRNTIILYLTVIELQTVHNN